MGAIMETREVLEENDRAEERPQGPSPEAVFEWTSSALRRTLGGGAIAVAILAGMALLRWWRTGSAGSLTLGVFFLFFLGIYALIAYSWRGYLGRHLQRLQARRAAAASDSGAGSVLENRAAPGEASAEGHEERGAGERARRE